MVVNWEEAIDQFDERVDQVMKLRIGIVLSPDGGALKPMMPPFKFGLGAAVGTGRQWMSWIHIDDLVNMILYGLDKGTSGTYNAVGPEPVTNKDFSRTLARVLGKPFFLPNVPSFVLKVLYGELADAVLGGNRVSAKKIQGEGFSFNYTKIEEALADLLK